MADQVEGGRTRIGGITCSEAELTIINRAAKKKKQSRAEFMRDAALIVATELEGEGGFQLISPEEARADPQLWDTYLTARTALQQMRDRLRATPPAPAPPVKRRR